jgi:hypothetical protein
MKRLRSVWRKVSSGNFCHNKREEMRSNEWKGENGRVDRIEQELSRKLLRKKERRASMNSRIGKRRRLRKKKGDT